MSLPTSLDINPQRRRLLKVAAASVAAGAGGTLAFPALAKAKPFAGVKLRGAAYQHGFFNILRKYIPEFEQHEYESDADRALRWNSVQAWGESLVSNHALIASDSQENDQVFIDLLDELLEVDPR